jgi:hypothetical protein
MLQISTSNSRNIFNYEIKTKTKYIIIGLSEPKFCPNIFVIRAIVQRICKFVLKRRKLNRTGTKISPRLNNNDFPAQIFALDLHVLGVSCCPIDGRDRRNWSLSSLCLSCSRPLSQRNCWIINIIFILGNNFDMSLRAMTPLEQRFPTN